MASADMRPESPKLWSMEQILEHTNDLVTQYGKLLEAELGDQDPKTFNLDLRIEQLSQELIVAKQTGVPVEKRDLLQKKIDNLKNAKAIETHVTKVNNELSELLNLIHKNTKY